MNDFSLNKILSIKKKKETHEIIYIQTIIKNIESRIENRKKNGKNDLFYEVSNFTPGLPLYDSIKIAKIVKEIMIKKSYKVNTLYENKLYIWWKPKNKTFPHIPKLLERIKNKITINAKKDKDNCIFEIPAFVPGFPLFDTDEASNMIKKEIEILGFVCKIIYNNQIFISWNVKEIEKQNNIKVEFRTDKEKRKNDKEKIKIINTEKYNTLKNPQKTNISMVEDSDSECDSEQNETITEDKGFEKYFDIQSNPANKDDFYPEASTFYKYFETPPPRILPEHQCHKSHSSSFKNNTKSIFPVTYTENTKSKVVFGKTKKKKNTSNYDNNRLNTFSNPERTKNNLNVKYTQDYIPASSSLSSNPNIINDLKNLQKQTLKIKKRRK